MLAHGLKEMTEYRMARKGRAMKLKVYALMAARAVGQVSREKSHGAVATSK
jgi:hypothetical protein